MKKFMDKDFLLESASAQELYRTAASEPIYDFHCHLIPSQIAENKRFDNLAEAWLGGDHYKWRQMRAFGIGERFITGDAEPYEKFLAWTRTLENLIGNPLYHWTHLELQRYFGIQETLTSKSAPSIWKKANALLSGEELSVRGIFRKFNVHTVGTTDDPADSLAFHEAIASGTAPIGKIATRIIPSFRPDKALNVDLPGFVEYMEKLSAASGIQITSVALVLDALIKRLDFFVSQGCRASDHALESPPFALVSESTIEAVFQKALAGEKVTKEEAESYKTKILVALAGEYAKRDIVMQLHFAALRNTNSRMFETLGPDTGYDASADREISRKLALLLSRINSQGRLPKIILYSLNPKDYYPLATIGGCFQGEPDIPGKIQLGSAWWFCDHRDGMEEQLKVLANIGMLSASVGMLTDSRSFLSYPRHEYFRRILCNLIGTWVENGEFPPDREKLAEIVSAVSFGNASRYFK